jgi:hypothetical protein
VQQTPVGRLIGGLLGDMLKFVFTVAALNYDEGVT